MWKGQMRRTLRYLTLLLLCAVPLYAVVHAASAQLADEQFARFYARYTGKWRPNYAKSIYLKGAPPPVRDIRVRDRFPEKGPSDTTTSSTRSMVESGRFRQETWRARWPVSTGRVHRGEHLASQGRHCASEYDRPVARWKEVRGGQHGSRGRWRVERLERRVLRAPGVSVAGDHARMARRHEPQDVSVSSKAATLPSTDCSQTPPARATARGAAC